jgi:hypothetical protein
MRRQLLGLHDTQFGLYLNLFEQVSRFAGAYSLGIVLKTMASKLVTLLSRSFLKRLTTCWRGGIWMGMARFLEPGRLLCLLASYSLCFCMRVQLSLSVLGLGVILSLTSCHDTLQPQLQQRVDGALAQAATHFHHLQRPDTLDLAALAPMPWDTVYLFWGYASTEHMHESQPHVRWRSGLSVEVPEHTKRFVFVHQGEAISYVDLPRNLVGAVHFRRSYPAADGETYISYKDSAGKNHPYGANQFARAQARFILVGGVDIAKPDLPNRGVKFFTYVPLSYFQARRVALGAAVQDCALDLHPLAGCARTDCRAQ